MNFEVVAYSIDSLISLLSKFSQASVELIKAKHHSTYFKEYFKKVAAKTIIVEKDYIDRDYLEDFASYYVKCFDGYEKKCTRIHFFLNDFSVENFSGLLKGEDTSLNIYKLQENYLGFVVIKPLPSTVIGRSCLKTYEHEGHRYFPIVRRYCANLYGIQLHINSLAFQEQDSVVAACATSALWSIFHGTGILFHHPIFSPAEITKKASEYLPTGTMEARIFPNKGLSIEQMAYAIRDVSLEPHLINPTSQFITQGTLYAYVRGKIPVLLGIALYDLKNDKYIGKHAVAITGYSISDNYISSVPDLDIKLNSFRIDRLYVHDDQVGPFARMVFDNVEMNSKSNLFETDQFSLKTFWRDTNQEIGNIRAIPSIILIPLYHKIRIPYSTIFNTIIYFHSFILFLNNYKLLWSNRNFEWDIYLTTINDFKSEFLNQKYIVGQELFDVLSEPLPHFIWRATATLDKQPVLDLLFDATDIEQGEFLLKMIEYDKEICSAIRSFSKVEEINKIFSASPAKEIIANLRKS